MFDFVTGFKYMFRVWLSCLQWHGNLWAVVYKLRTAGKCGWYRSVICLRSFLIMSEKHIPVVGWLLARKWDRGFILAILVQEWTSTTFRNFQRAYASIWRRVHRKDKFDVFSHVSWVLRRPWFWIYIWHNEVLPLCYEPAITPEVVWLS